MLNSSRCSQFISWPPKKVLSPQLDITVTSDELKARISDKQERVHKYMEYAVLIGELLPTQLRRGHASPSITTGLGSP